MSSKAAHFARIPPLDMGRAAHACQAGMVAWFRLNPYIPPTFRSSLMI